MWAGNPFGHPAWVRAHASVLEPDLVVEDLDDGIGGTVAIGHVPGGPLRLLGDRMSDLLDVGAAGLDAVLGVASERRHALRVGPVPHDVAVALVDRHPGTHVESCTSSPVIRFGGTTWDGYLAGAEARRRRRVAGEAVRLLADPAVEVIEARDPEEVGPAVKVLADLHHRRFGSRSASFTDPKVAFLGAALPAMAADGAVVIRTLHLNGEPVAAVLCFETPEARWFYQSGWDPAHEQRSVGRALFADTVRATCQGGRDFFLLRGDEPYKTWWATGDEPVATVVAAW